jgi:hypothetical protein
MGFGGGDYDAGEWDLLGQTVSVELVNLSFIDSKNHRLNVRIIWYPSVSPNAVFLVCIPNAT